MAETIDCAVIGAGVVGLAAARALARAGREVVILEAAESIGTGVSSRSSEVIHAGLYYPRNSLKARLCVAGRAALYAFCRDHGVPHARCGKLVVAATAAELPALAALKTRAAGNGVDDLVELAPEDLRALEPALSAAGALLSPSTGIVDSHALMLALLGEAEERGAALALASPVVGGRAVDGGVEIDVGGAAPCTVRARGVVIAAGLRAREVAASIDGVPADSIPPLRLAKGSYFSYARRAPFRHLVYPVPEARFAGLGIHATLDLAGRVRFGPDVEWLAGGTRPEDVDYDVDPARAARFAEAIRRYFPALDETALAPDYAGVRPKLNGPGEPPADFAVVGPRDHGIAGLVALYGIESPGLTAALALGEEIVRRLDG